MGVHGVPENPSPSQSPGLLTCSRAGFLDNVLDSKVDSLIQDHSSQVGYLHPIKQGRRNGAAVTEERSKEALALTPETVSQHPAIIKHHRTCGPLERRGETCHSTSQSASLGIQQWLNRQYHTHESPMQSAHHWSFYYNERH